MSQQTSTILLRGGLDLITPQIAIPAGRVISSINYEPDVAGYTSSAGYERFDGQPSPSAGTDAATIALRRAAILKVPGVGPVRGVYVYASLMWAFRDQADGTGAMFKATGAGWVQQTFGSTLYFNLGTLTFTEGETVTGGTSGATGVVQRVILQSGAWSGTAAGFLVLSGVTGTFSAAENITSAGGASKAVAAQTAIALPAGGIYEFTTHNFYGAAKSARLYFVNGVGTAFEWDGTVLAPISSGISTGTLFGYLQQAAGAPDSVLTAGGDDIIMNETGIDNPAYIAVYRNHLFLGYAVGAVVFSSIGTPLEYRVITGSGTFAFGDAMTGMLVTASSLIIFGRGLIEYVAGNDSSDFQKATVTEAAGAVLRSPKVFAESPIYLDDGGLRKLSSSAAYGDFKTGTLTQLVEPLFRKKRLAAIVPTTAMVVTAKDQYRMYWNDGTGIVLFMGLKYPELLPFKFPASFFTSCVGEVDSGMGDRLFAGGDDGYVYELDKGTSFDGATIDAYIRLAFNTIQSPTQLKRFMRFAAEVVCEDVIDVSIAYHVDYAHGAASALAIQSATSGFPIVTTDLYGSVNWTKATQGEVSKHLAGIGRNIAVTLVTSSATTKQHTFASSTLNFSPRRMVR